MKQRSCLDLASCAACVEAMGDNVQTFMDFTGASADEARPVKRLQ